ncbi:MAG: hypothetical protein A2289_06935 [Deltaproteobacteria bacterium RIFOXYA12_FULL_58_15]|nr:MAG: hypothetical protein A2289_06935 [Deltaproteobacteria bacterium RIFOXYA12_FULL_58_15]OGR14400.1 MAG: hypothetical protein A2341_04595 [Deltaproteobacteria bacterium RIFOXYB12_FULL_58_9]
MATILVVGCREATPQPRGNADEDFMGDFPGDSTRSDADEPHGCPSGTPLAFPFDPDAKDRAFADLAILQGDTANDPVWYDEWGTFSNAKMHVDLPNCTGATLVDDLVWQVVEAWPNVFALDRSEWVGASSLLSNIPCDNASATTSLAYQRTTIGGQPIYNSQAIRFYLGQDTNGFYLRMLDSFGYLPTAPTALAQTLATCAPSSQTVLEQGVFAATYTFERFVACQVVEEGKYAPQPGDTMVVTAPPRWLWYPDADNTWGLVLVYEGELIVALENAGPLDGTSAACWRVGWTLTFDAVTGKVYWSQAGLDGCIVC